MRFHLISLVTAALALPALADVTLYGRPDFQGRSLTLRDPARNLERDGFGGRASSVIVRGGPYEFCDDRGFNGNCVVLDPGRYPSLAEVGMNNAIVSVRPARGVAEITLFGREEFRGRSFTAQEPVRNLERHNFGSRASSAIVRGGRFEVCEERGFEGRCMVLRPGQYPSLADMGMNDSITSIRPLARGAQFEERRFAPPPPVAYDYRRRPQERLFEAEVVDVRAVYGRPEQRCWVEREAVNAPLNESNLGGAIVGGIIGGILGHQVGGGRGQDVATAGGAVAGALIGRNLASPTYGSRDVERCAPSQASGPPDYWDVRYRFRGEERSVQMTRAPGRTITVNEAGEPRA